MSDDSNPLALAAALTRRTEQLCIGLERGTADIYELATPVTAELLRWWFGEDACQSRTFNFHSGQRQAILNVIVAHEVLASPNLKDLYQLVCADALLEGTRLAAVTQGKHGHPKYCLKMAAGTGKTWVLQALLVWQLLNRTAALDKGRDDPRFTRRFLIVAPGLIVYERLLDAFLGKENTDKSRDFASSDIASYAELFTPPARRERIAQFVRGNVCQKQEIGLKATGNGMIAITNWHLLSEAEEEAEQDEAERIDTPGMVADAARVACDVLPLAPGRAAGNSLDVLDRRWARGNVLNYLADLPDLMVFNDETHHIHELKKEGETTEVEWQNSLSIIAAGKGRRFVQMDFSATPYNDVGNGRKKAKLYFPHIVVDFDLKAAMRLGLVKSLALDKRKELGALPLEFKAERDEDGNVQLAEGQRVMLRAGLQKLRKLEADFARLDPDRHPKMLVVCEDTTVSPLVADFLRDEGLHDEDVLTVDSGRKAELGEKDWAPLRQRLFNVDRHAQPRVIVSVLMLREGFDVNNICVIVPLRSSQAPILLEQTIGRGLRLMWRDPEYADIKRDNRERIDRGEEPGSLIDILSIVEHPAFQSFYDELMREGLVGETGDDEGSSTGDLIAAELREDFERYDFAIPFILRETDENVEHLPIDVAALSPFSAMSRAKLRAEEHAVGGATEVRHRRLSEVTKLMVRESASLEVTKCIYTRLPYPTRSGGLERAFIEWAQADAGVEAFCKISENRHDFARLRYVKDDGMPAFYFPDFLVRTADAIYLVETKAQQQVGHPDVQRKLKAATTWCERINALEPGQRGERTWHYALVGESLFYYWCEEDARLGELLAFSCACEVPTAQSQGGLALGD